MLESIQGTTGRLKASERREYRRVVSRLGPPHVGSAVSMPRKMLAYGLCAALFVHVAMTLMAPGRWVVADPAVEVARPEVFGRWAAGLLLGSFVFYHLAPRGVAFWAIRKRRAPERMVVLATREGVSIEAPEGQWRWSWSGLRRAVETRSLWLLEDAGGYWLHLRKAGFSECGLEGLRDLLERHVAVTSSEVDRW